MKYAHATGGDFGAAYWNAVEQLIQEGCQS